ncbi:TM2 domain-containing protein [Shewanella gaetbuli]
MKTVFCSQCSHTINVSNEVCSQCQTIQGLEALAGVDPNIKIKNQKLAVLFGFMFGGVGLHKFYLGQHLKGCLYLCFCWTLVPMVVGWIDAVKTLKMSAYKFQQRYSQDNVLKSI